MVERVIVTSGTRKRAVARAVVRAGKGIISVNGKPIKNCDPELSRLRLLEPIMLAGDLANKVDIAVDISGGGWSSQTEAARLAIAKGFVDFFADENLKKKYLEYDRHLLVADTRRKEQRKPLTHSHARSKRQKSYR